MICGPQEVCRGDDTLFAWPMDASFFRARLKSHLLLANRCIFLSSSSSIPPTLGQSMHLSFELVLNPTQFYIKEFGCVVADSSSPGGRAVLGGLCMSTLPCSRLCLSRAHRNAPYLLSFISYPTSSSRIFSSASCGVLVQPAPSNPVSR